ncbi:MAG: hypothetical protein LC118_14025 [Dehalococcoidia bacterium]|nr:hypothetical protein [Dehalococcoidia bacterium]
MDCCSRRASPWFRAAVLPKDPQCGNGEIEPSRQLLGKQFVNAPGGAVLLGRIVGLPRFVEQLDIGRQFVALEGRVEADGDRQLLGLCRGSGTSVAPATFQPAQQEARVALASCLGWKRVRLGQLPSRRHDHRLTWPMGFAEQPAACSPYGLQSRHPGRVAEPGERVGVRQVVQHVDVGVVRQPHLEWRDRDVGIWPCGECCGW